MSFSISIDRLIERDILQGHAAPILYAAWALAGLFPEGDLNNLRKIDSDLEGHPTPRLNFIDVATGSLGQGLSCAAGMAYTGKYFDKARCVTQSDFPWIRQLIIILIFKLPEIEELCILRPPV